MEVVVRANRPGPVVRKESWTVELPGALPIGILVAGDGGWMQQCPCHPQKLIDKPIADTKRTHTLILTQIE